MGMMNIAALKTLRVQIHEKFKDKYITNSFFVVSKMLLM